MGLFRKERTTKESFGRIGKKIGVSLADPGSMYDRNLKKAGVGKRDRQTFKSGIDYSYGALTLGVGPVAKLAMDEGRQREAQKKKKKGKQVKGKARFR
tara:strand:- start:464 stop:757 length:294 start_codon:yes stop_codon:yes gene_type:complete